MTQARKPKRVLISPWPVVDIKVGKRIRRDMGDLDALAANMDEDGLFQAIGLKPDGTLIWGERRYRAAKLLGWTHIEVKVVDLDSIGRGEYVENAFRKNFTLSEAVAIKRALEPLEKAAAKERQREGGRSGGKASGKLPEASKGNAADKVAKAAGMARRTLENAEEIVDAAEAEPEKYGGHCSCFPPSRQTITLLRRGDIFTIFDAKKYKSAA
jgi:ParB family chromosome partitioning protein